MKNIFRIIATALLLACVMTAFAGCKNELDSTEEEKNIVMTVGSYDVPMELYRYLVMSYKSELGDVEITPELEGEIKYNVECALKDIYAVFAVCAEHGIEMDDKAVMASVDAEVKAYRDSFEDTDAYKAELQTLYMNHSVYRFMTSKVKFSDELYYKLINDKTIESDEDKLREIVEGDGFIRIKQVLVFGEGGGKTYDGTYFVAGSEHTDEEAKAIAEDVWEKAAAGEDFDALVKEYGEDLYMFNNTDGYYICRGMWEEDAEAAAFALDIGEVSEPVKVDAGYSVMLRLDKDSAYVEKHTDDMAEDYLAAQFSAILTEKSESLEVEYKESFDEISVVDMK